MFEETCEEYDIYSSEDLVKIIGKSIFSEKSWFVRPIITYMCTSDQCFTDT